MICDRALLRGLAEVVCEVVGAAGEVEYCHAGGIYGCRHYECAVVAYSLGHGAAHEHSEPDAYVPRSEQCGIGCSAL